MTSCMGSRSMASSVTRTSSISPRVLGSTTATRASTAWASSPFVRWCAGGAPLGPMGEHYEIDADTVLDHADGSALAT